MKTAKTFRAEIGGQPFSAEFSDMAGRADGAVLVRHGETAVLVAAVMGSAKEHLDYFPLSVEYEERFYAAGMILGSRFMRREGRPSDAAVLNARLVDRAIRPLFNHEMRNEVQVVVTALSIDEANDPDVAAIVGASL
ncbi:MAG: polyribonucleotide nucleotidyltransferase, partial [Parcubacteria group bacterium]|nr:polyribonucleotide nucleotidyltransferase [Parcubacteria group bacterium]